MISGNSFGVKSDASILVFSCIFVSLYGSNVSMIALFMNFCQQACLPKGSHLIQILKKAIEEPSRSVFFSALVQTFRLVRIITLASMFLNVELRLHRAKSKNINK